MKLGFHGATTMTSDLQTDVAASAHAGFKALELWAAKVARMPADGLAIAKTAFSLVEQTQSYIGEQATGFLVHAFATNLRFEEDEFQEVPVSAPAPAAQAARG